MYKYKYNYIHIYIYMYVHFFLKYLIIGKLLNTFVYNIINYLLFNELIHEIKLHPICIELTIIT